MKIDQIEKFYSDDSKIYDDRWVKEGGNYTNRTQIEIVKRLTSTWKNQNLLEVGCGSSRFSVILAKNNPNMIFLDISDAMLEMTLQRVGNSHKGLNASVYKIPLPSKSIDAVLSINVFNHIEDINKAFSEINRVLVDGGELVINFTNIFSYYLLAGLIVNLKQESLGRKVYSHWLKPGTVSDSLEINGFEIIEQVGNVFVPKYLDAPIIREIIIFLDKVTTRSFLHIFSPAIFMKCKKVRDATPKISKVDISH